MGKFFTYDNKFFQGIGKLTDCFFLSILWVLFCIPIVTAGAATTAMYYTINKSLRNNMGYVWRSFWESFKSNFKQSTIVWLICLVVGVVFGVDIYVTREMLANNQALGALFYLFLVMAVFLVLWMCYLFPYIARFENTTKQILKNCGLIAIANLPKTVLLAVLLIITILVLYLLPVLIMIVPALSMWIMNYVLESVFRRYMSEEDLEREKEMDMENRR